MLAKRRRVYQTSKMNETQKSIEELLSLWSKDPDFLENLSSWQTTPPADAVWGSFPAWLDANLINALQNAGIQAPYLHQVIAFEHLHDGRNLVIATGTASGKTLCYDVPVLDSLLKDPKARALYLFPTKALAQDQLGSLQSLLSQLPTDTSIKVAIYDGDTPTNQRLSIRKETRILLTNPDMLHQGILPHHTNWQAVFSGLRYVVIDEAHIYRGVFGSHIANLLRRLKRIAAFYHSYPLFVLTSATIGNPTELASALIEAPVEAVLNDGSPHGRRHFLVYNPPLVDQKLGIRISALQTAVSFTKKLLVEGKQSLVFARTRRTVEMLLTYLLGQLRFQERSLVRGYRSGYLKEQRREIELGLKNGSIRSVIATSALELGIDIGDLESVIMVGYPGSIATTRQRAGRAGRKQQESLAILIAAPDAMDQYLARHSEYLTENNPENGLIDPNNLFILHQHIKSAAFELPFCNGDRFGAVPDNLLNSMLKIMCNEGLLIQQDTRYFWIADKYPSAEISLRSSSGKQVTLIEENTTGTVRIIGEIDASSAPLLVHPQAIYLHEAETYEVKVLDLEQGRCLLLPAQPEYYTISSTNTEIERYSSLDHQEFNHFRKDYGELSLRISVDSFRKIRWFTNETIGTGTIELPPRHLDTTGFWIYPAKSLVDSLEEQGLWNAAPNAYGADWPSLRRKILLRDSFRCRACGGTFPETQLEVHHIKPFRTFSDPNMANAASNLVSLCSSCHRLAEISVRVRSGLAGATYALHNLAPLMVMCDTGDLGMKAEMRSVLAEANPAILVYDNVPGGIGLSQRLYEEHRNWFGKAAEMVMDCPCDAGCPACVGPVGEDGYGGKDEAAALLRGLL